MGSKVPSAGIANSSQGFFGSIRPSARADRSALRATNNIDQPGEASCMGEA
jgi:hypothetical protein